MCRVIGQPRSTQRYRRVGADDEAALTEAIVRLASEYGRYGYRRVTALLRGEGWQVNHKRVERIWRREGLKVPVKQPKRGRLWLNDGSCIRLRPIGSVRRFVLGPFCQTLTNLSPKMTANCVLASYHSRGGRFHASAA